jgi:5-methylthioadenosine/S-adenosylhomocysteine deaminase
MAVTCVREASWAIVWDASTAAHAYARHVDVAFDASGILHVGKRFGGRVDVEIDGRERLVMPGLVDVHCHPSAQAIVRGFTEEFGDPLRFFSSRHAFRQSFQPDGDALRASAAFTLGELLAGGVTTVVDLSHAYPGWLDVLAASGVRACVAPMYRSATWHTDTGRETKYEWHADGGEAAFAEARDVMDQAERHPSGLFTAMVAPAQVDTCSEDLLRRSAALAEATGRPLHVHAAQSYAEFMGMVRRFDRTPIEWLADIGFLGPRTIIGHAVFTDEHPWLHYPTRRDLSLLVGSGTAIAHAPTVFARDGTLLHDLGAYHRSGLTIGIGTDTHPHAMLEELRWAEVLARVAAGPRHALGTERVFSFATVGGATALGRDDIGRLAVGAQADVVVVDLSHPSMQPLRDPLRSLVYAAAERPVEQVFVAGRHVVVDGMVTTVDRRAAAQALAAGQARAAARVSARDPGGRGVDDIAPLALPLLRS